MSANTFPYLAADLENVCREAALHALRSNMEGAVVGQDHFDHVLRQVPPSLTAAQLIQYAELQAKWEATR